MPWEGATWIPHEVVGGNATTFTELMQYANAVTGDMFGLLFLGATFLILFIASSTKTDSGASLSASLFITTIISYIMGAMDIVGDYVAWVITFMLVGSVILLYKGGSGNV